MPYKFEIFELVETLKSNNNSICIRGCEAILNNSKKYLND